MVSKKMQSRVKTSIREIPRVSVGLPVYNGERFLRPALDCLLAQTYTDFEIVITDNCSTDGTEEICHTYAAQDSRIRYYRNPANIGVDRNFNRSFRLSRGDYFRWAAADDLCAPTLLETCVRMLDQRTDAVLCYPKTRLIDENGSPIKDHEDYLDLQYRSASRRFGFLLLRFVLCNVCYGLMRSCVLKRTSLFGSYFSSDEVFLGELALHGPFVEIPEYLFYRRMHAGMAVRKYANRYEAMIMSEPDGKGKLFFPNWKIFTGHLSSIRRAPISWKERVRCYTKMHIWLDRWGTGLGEDLKVAAKWLIQQRDHFSSEVNS